MASVLLVSDIRLGDRNIASTITYQLILQRLGHSLTFVPVQKYTPINPDLAQIVADSSPDAIVLATASSVPQEHRRTVYDHLRQYGKPILVADLNVPTSPPNPLRIETGDAYVDAFRLAYQIREAMPRALDQLLAASK